jgi:O-antigen ligase
LAIEAAPWRVALTPAVLIGVLALAIAARYPAKPSPRLPPEVAGGGSLLLLGAAVSVFGSGDPQLSALTMVLAVSAPAAVLFAIARADLPWRVVVGAFLAVSCALLLRADVIFLLDWGVPTTGDLYQAKYSNFPYDFHYYSLGNPDHTAGWLLIPWTIVAFWLFERGLSRQVRAALAAAGMILIASLLLTYARFALATAVVIGVLAVLTGPLPSRRKAAAVALIGALVVGGIATNVQYLASLFATNSNASVPERVRSLADGIAALGSNPLTGVGLGRFGPEGGYIAAHSSIVQGAAEMGALGLSALLLLTYGLVAHAVRVVRGSGWHGLGPAIALAGAVYAIHAALAASANEGLYSGYVSVWGLTTALVLGLSLALEHARASKVDRAATVRRS